MGPARKAFRRPEVTTPSFWYVMSVSSNARRFFFNRVWNKAEGERPLELIIRSDLTVSNSEERRKPVQKVGLRNNRFSE